MITKAEASKVIQAVDVSWQDVPLRPETIAVWEGELQRPDHFIEFQDCIAAVKFLIDTSERRPSYAELYLESRAQFKVRRDAEHDAERNVRLAGELTS